MGKGENGLDEKNVTVPAGWSDKVIKLYFEAVDGLAEIYVNKKKGAAPAFIKYQSGCSGLYISTLTEFANSEKGFSTLAESELSQSGNGLEVLWKYTDGELLRYYVCKVKG